MAQHRAPSLFIFLTNLIERTRRIIYNRKMKMITFSQQFVFVSLLWIFHDFRLFLYILMHASCHATHSIERYSRLVCETVDWSSDLWIINYDWISVKYPSWYTVVDIIWSRRRCLRRRRLKAWHAPQIIQIRCEDIILMAMRYEPNVGEWRSF